jgi:uncharacterized protein YndB with AHSA1/START domain
MYSTSVTHHVDAPRAAVYRALLDPDAVARWRVPTGMRGQVHEFDAREGGCFRVSLTYEVPGETGKSGLHTDTYQGRFARLVPDTEVVEELEFESDDPVFAGSMTMTTTLADAGDGTDVVILHEGIPDGVARTDNEAGTRMALENLAAYVETGRHDRR